jgi:hypothetical protein
VAGQQRRHLKRLLLREVIEKIGGPAPRGTCGLLDKVIAQVLIKRLRKGSQGSRDTLKADVRSFLRQRQQTSRWRAPEADSVYEAVETMAPAIVFDILRILDEESGLQPGELRLNPPVGTKGEEGPVKRNWPHWMVLMHAIGALNDELHHAAQLQRAKGDNGDGQVRHQRRSFAPVCDLAKVVNIPLNNSTMDEMVHALKTDARRNNQPLPDSLEQYRTRYGA